MELTAITSRGILAHMQSRAYWHKEYERKWGFPLPAEYVTLAERKCFDLPEPSGCYHQLIHSPYLWMPEMEWRSFPDLLHPDMTAGEAKPGFASFAFTGGGDDWCWYAPAAIGGRVPVVQCPHDDCDATFYAPDFISAIYRNILEASLGGFGRDQSNPIEREYLRRWSKELGPMLPPAAAQTLASLVAAPVKQFTIGRYEQKGLITPDELAALIERDVAFDRLDQRIEWISP